MSNPHAMRIPDLDLDLLRGFVAVAERGGFTAAGQALGLTQSAVSLKVKRLEELVQRRVFERTSRSIALTRDGETLLAYARRILALNDEAVRRLVAPPVAGRFRLGVADHFVPRNLAPLLARLRPHLARGAAGGRGRPQPRIAGGAGEGRTRPGAGEAAGRRDGRPADLDRERGLGRRPGLAGAGGAPLPLAMLPPGCMFRDRALAALARAGLAFEVVYTSASLLGVAAAAQAGFALTVLGRGGLPPGLAEVPGLPPLGTVEMCLFGDTAGQNPLAEPLMRFLRESLSAADLAAAA
ncbi:LysR family transcriptional regulator [Dankookia sp. P2]|uniref:LysR family transcriptional regulator n=1 Tax=Dankookia sp. P2 TaxID=3423955 RepID=UPI003D677F3B